MPGDLLLQPMAVTSECFQQWHSQLPDAIDYFFRGGGAAINLCLSLLLFLVFLAAKLLVWRERCPLNGGDPCLMRRRQETFCF